MREGYQHERTNRLRQPTSLSDEVGMCVTLEPLRDMGREHVRVTSISASLWYDLKRWTNSRSSLRCASDHR